jgi:membrane fusion protein (multidrug efflux system)
MTATTTGTTLAKPEGDEIPIKNERGHCCPPQPTVLNSPAEEHFDLEHSIERDAAPRHPSRLKVGAGIVVLIAAACGGYFWWNWARTWVGTDNAYVSGHIHTVSARVPGTVKEVFVQENQTVAAGELLARLDPSDLEVRRQQTLAQLAQADAQVQQAEAQISQARAQLSRERARAPKAQQDFARAGSLYHDSAGAISRQEFDQAQAENDAAQAGLEAAQAALISTTAMAAAAQAQQKAGAANLHEAELQLSYTEIRAPAPGRIGKKNVETGNRLQPGQALFGLVEPEVWVTANFKETQLARLKPEQRVVVKIDALPGRTFMAHLDSVAPASGAQFALLPPDNATGNFTKIVQRIPVKVVFDAQALASCAGRLAPGMSAAVEVKVRE